MSDADRIAQTNRDASAGPSYRAHVDDLSCQRPHVFLLGAGASRAAFPNGDAHGKHVPLMDDLIETLDLAPVLSQCGVAWKDRNFEELYAQLASDERHQKLTARIEMRVREYFAQLQLPAAPTLYDRLVLSLRPKDVVATFNWDPFLFDAWARNDAAAGHPETFYLHGNVRVGYCAEHRKASSIDLQCPTCGQPFTATRLIFPVTMKNYAADPYTSAQWNNLKHALKHAYILTIFGYSAPTSDTEAVTLLRNAWGPPVTRNLEEIEIIDIKGDEELRTTWEPFIHTHHYRTYTSLYTSWIAEYPRRSCEAMWSTLMENNPHSPAGLPSDADFPELWTWLEPLLRAEHQPT